MATAVLEKDHEAPSHRTSQSRSVMTAPAAVWPHLYGQITSQSCEAGSSLASCEGVDCLPENCLVQVEGSPGPRELGTVRIGERVLCNDSLTGRTCYIDVANAEIVEHAQEGPATWVRVTLS